MNNTKESGYWNNRKNRLEELNKYLIKYGELRDVMNNHPNLYHAFHKYNDSMSKACLELGYDYTVIGRQGKKFYSDFDNFADALRFLINMFGRFPTRDEIISNLKVSNRMIAKHGGMYEIKRKMNYSDKLDLVDDNGWFNKSSYEYNVAQYLIHNTEIKYKRESTPFSNESRYFRSDFEFIVIRNDKEVPIHIEVWGEVSSSKNPTEREIEYIENMNFKKSLYEKNNIEYISFYGYEFNKNNYDEIQKILYKRLSPYLNLKKVKIDNNLLVSPSMMSDEEIKNELLKYSEDGIKLPTIRYYLQHTKNSSLYTAILKKHGKYENFAKAVNIELSHDKKEVTKERVFNELITLLKKGKTITKENINKYTNIESNYLVDLFGSVYNAKLNLYTELTETIDIIKDNLEEIKSLIYIRDRIHSNQKLVNLELQFKANDVLNKLNSQAKENAEYEVMSYFIKENIQDLSFKFFKDEFFKTINKNKCAITFKGFNEHSAFIGAYSYNHKLNLKTWLDIVRYYEVENYMNDYIQEEFDKFISSDTDTYRFATFVDNHEYISSSLVPNDSSYYLSNSKKKLFMIKKNDFSIQDLEENFTYLIKKYNRVPQYNEFNDETYISINTYATILNLKGKVYDDVVKRFSTKDQYDEYRERRLENKRSSILKVEYKHDYLEENFKNRFNEFYNNNGKYPTRNDFNEISDISAKVYYNRLNLKTWSELKDFYFSKR